MHRTAPQPLVLISLIMLSVGCNRQASESPDRRGVSEVGEVRITVDFGDGRTAETVLRDVQPGTTVEALMRRTDAFGHVRITGSGTTAMVQSIDGVEMHGGKGWLYQVDGRWAERGIGQTRVDPGSEILWRYGKFDTATAGDGAGS